jgi:excisionase family DNA binding protein
MEKLLTISTLVDATEFSESYFRKAIATGKLPVLRVGGGRAIRIRASDAERFLTQRPRVLGSGSGS